MERTREFLKSKKGFTLVELMIVVVIVGILAAVAVPMYRTNVKKAMASEGVALMGSVRTAQRVYFAEHQTYCTNANVAELGISTSGNKYFASFSITAAGAAAFTASTSGTGDAAGITVTIDQDGTIVQTGL